MRLSSIPPATRPIHPIPPSPTQKCPPMLLDHPCATLSLTPEPLNGVRTSGRASGHNASALGQASPLALLIRMVY